MRALYRLIEIRTLGLPVDTQTLEQTINTIRESDPHLLYSVDENGYAPIHFAALTLDLEAIRLLLSTPELGTTNVPEGGVTNPLFRKDNILGRTPLEICEYAAQRRLQDRQSLSNWNLTPDRSAECISELDKATEALKVVKASTAAEAPKAAETSKAAGASKAAETPNSTGCTCGQCIDGLISPTMKGKLLGMTLRSFIPPSTKDVKLTTV